LRSIPDYCDYRINGKTNQIGENEWAEKIAGISNFRLLFSVKGAFGRHLTRLGGFLNL